MIKQRNFRCYTILLLRKILSLKMRLTKYNNNKDYHMNKFKLKYTKCLKKEMYLLNQLSNKLLWESSH